MALAEFRKEIAANPSFGQAYLRAGTIEVERNRLGEARDMLLGAVSHSPEDASAHFELGRFYLKAKQPELAQGQFLEALRLDPKLIRAHYGLAQALLALGKGDEAQREFRAFSELLARNRSAQRGASASGE